MLTAIAVVVASLPGLLAYVWGRKLLRSPDDPSLPERAAAWRHRLVVSFATSVAILIVLLPRDAPWAVPLTVLACLAGVFPIRRALFGERWDFIAYLAHLARLTVGVGGFWLLLLFAPALVAWARPHVWPLATTLALVLVAWGLAYPWILLWVLGATPLGQPELEERFRAIAERSTAPRPRLWRVGAQEGRWANAFALPATRTPAVVFTRTLLEAFDMDELAAVFAHEQAHLEHFDARRVKRLAALQTLAVLLGTLGAAAAFERLEGASTAIILGWPLLLLVAVFVRVVRHRAHETESDRRAVELCGDPHALARALVKLHTLALLPRRLTLDEEDRATHPSLANRLRAIEGLARAAEPPTTGDGTWPAVLAGADPGSWVLLGERQAHWLEGVPDRTPRDAEALRAAALRVRSFAYSELVELRLQPRGPGHVLVASDRTGAAWSLPLATGEAALTHEALDAVDRRLAPASAARPERKALGALVACAGAIMALLSWSAAVVPALLAIVLQHPGPLAAFGASALVAATLASASGGPPGPALDPDLAPLARLGLAACGAVALWIAGTTAWRERAGRTRTAPWAALALGLLAVVFLVLPLAALATGGVLRAHVAARDHPTGAVLLFAASAALLVVPRRWSRGAAAVAAALATVPLILGTSTFASRFVTDPFFAPGAGGQTSSTLSPQLIDEQTLPATTGQLEMSPSGGSWAIRRFEFSNDGTPPVNTMIVGSEHGIRHEYPADDLVLLDDTRLLALFREEGHPTVELRPHDPAAPAHWRADLEPLLEGAQLSANPATGQWRVTGIQGETGAFVRVTGDAEGSFTVDRLEPGSEGAVWVVGDGPAALGIASHFDETAEELLETELDDDAPSLWWVLAGYTGMGPGARVLSLDDDGARELYESQLHVQCDAPRPGETLPLCRANDGKRTSLWRVDPASGQARFVARIDGFTWPARPQSGGWLLLVNAGTRQRLHLLHDERLERLDVGDTPPWIQAAAGYEGGVGVVVSDSGHRTRLRRYSLP